MVPRVAGQASAALPEAPSFSRIVPERRPDEESPDDAEDDPPRGDAEASPAFGPPPYPLPHLVYSKVPEEGGPVGLIELTQPYPLTTAMPTQTTKTRPKGQDSSSAVQSSADPPPRLAATRIVPTVLKARPA